MGLNSYVYIYTFSARDGKIFLIGMNLSKKEKKMKEKKTFRSIPGLSREEEEKQLADILTIAQGNLKHTREQIRSLSEEV